jgi:osmotically-inducible protein OsmY
MKKNLQLVLVLLMLLLGGCASLIVSSPGGRQTAGSSISKEDARITNKINSSLVREPGISSLDVYVSSYQGIVTLRGYVASQKMKNRAADISVSVPGVKSVRNQLRIK